MKQALGVAALLLAGCTPAYDTIPATTAVATTAVVTGVTDDDMLKMRSGAGTGYRVIVGLPNGTVVRNHGCDRIGGTPWCKVSLDEARGLQGYVSGHYLQDR